METFMPILKFFLRINKGLGAPEGGTEPEVEL
jgi:hypothetical protein